MSDLLYTRIQQALRRRGLHLCACAKGHSIDLSDKPEVIMAIQEIVEEVAKESKSGA